MPTKRNASITILLILAGLLLTITLWPPGTWAAPTVRLAQRPLAAIWTLNPTDDTFVRAGAPITNFDGHEYELSVTTGVDGTPADIAYLRFDLSPISATHPITSLTLRLYNQVGPGSSVTVTVYSAASDDWNGDTAGNGDETTLTYNNAPAEVAALASVAGSASAAWMEFSSITLTNYVTQQLAANGGNDLVTFRLKVTSGGMADINSFEDRENGGGTGNKPQLVIDQPTAVNLLSFTAQGYANKVILEWVTLFERDVLGFHLHRRQGDVGPYTRLNPALIPGQGGAMMATYRYTDTTVLKGETYDYQLEEVDIFGQSTFYGPVTTTAGAGWQVYLPMIVR